MPMMGMFGGMSSKGFGQFARKPIVVGAFGLFPVNNSTSTQKYSFADNIVVPGSAMKASTSNFCCGAGNSVFGVIFSVSTRNEQKYAFASGATSTKTNVLPATLSSGSAFGNADTMLVHQGSSSNYTQTFVFTYSSETAVAGLADTRAGDFGSTQMSGNTTIAITRNYRAANTSKYTYSSNAFGAGTAFGAAVTGGGAFSNATFGVWGANTTTVASKYVFANDALAITTSFTTNLGYGSACGNDTVGVYQAEVGSITNVHTWATDGVVAGTTLPQAPGRSTVAFGTGTTGVNM